MREGRGHRGAGAWWGCDGAVSCLCLNSCRHQVCHLPDTETLLHPHLRCCRPGFRPSTSHTSCLVGAPGARRGGGVGRQAVVPHAPLALHVTSTCSRVLSPKPKTLQWRRQCVRCLTMSRRSGPQQQTTKRRRPARRPSRRRRRTSRWRSPAAPSCCCRWGCPKSPCSGW